MATLQISEYVRRIEAKATAHEFRYRRMNAVMLRSDALAVATLEVLSELESDQSDDQTKVANDLPNNPLGKLFAIGNQALNGTFYLSVLKRGMAMVTEQRQLESGI